MYNNNGLFLIHLLKIRIMAKNDYTAWKKKIEGMKYKKEISFCIIVKSRANGTRDAVRRGIW